MKIKIQIARVSFWIILGIAILLANLALVHPSPILQESTPTPAAQIGTNPITFGGQDEAGSTDEIMIVAVVIVLVVIIPILLMRRSWENGKRKNP